MQGETLMRFEPVPSPLESMRLWSARSGFYSFVISMETMNPPDPNWNGYNASWKHVGADMKPFGKQPANRIEGGPWQTWAQAERACRETLRQLRAKQ